MSDNVRFSPIKAMILAAGRGNRLRPLTDTLPKPLIPVCGKPLIEYHIEKLAAIGVTEIVINHAWLGQTLEQHLGHGERWGVKLYYSPEPEGGLETAGGIINALPLLGESPFLVINGDVYCDFQFEHLLNQAKKMRENSTCLAHLILVPSPEHNQTGDFALTEQQHVIEAGNETFAGLSVLSPKLFKHYDVAFLKLAPILREAMQKKLVSGCLFTGYWSDVGTVKRLAETQKQLGCK